MTLDERQEHVHIGVVHPSVVGFARDDWRAGVICAGFDAGNVSRSTSADADAAIVSDLVPAIRISTANPHDALSAGGSRGHAAAPAQRAQATMLVAQMAVSVCCSWRRR